MLRACTVDLSTTAATACTWAVLGMFLLALAPSRLSADGPESPNAAEAVSSPGFAYDPEKEEGPHPQSDFEWWYHFGFFKRKGAERFEYSFVSSFQRSKAGRYLFYNLSELTTGRNRHFAFVDRSLLGRDDQPADNDSPGLGKRLANWLQDTLSPLPEGHEFLPPSAPPPEPAKSALWLDYGDHCFQKEKASYRNVYKNPEYSLELTLRRLGPALPVLGTGLTGLHRPEDQHYYSYPRMSALGRLRLGRDEADVEGEFWYDHQWGKIVSSVPMKWCWWGLRLKDGRNLSLFFLQDGKTGETVQRGLTVQHPDAKTEVFRDVEFLPGRPWTSPHDRTYHLDWEVRVRPIDMTLRLRAHAEDHEIPVLLYQWIWEGPCLAEVALPGAEAVKGSGFQEMIGQDQ
jgi:predicted secreted hydrolase